MYCTKDHNLPGYSVNSISLYCSSIPFMLKWVKKLSLPISDQAVGLVVMHVPTLLTYKPVSLIMNVARFDNRANVKIMSEKNDSRNKIHKKNQL